MSPSRAAILADSRRGQPGSENRRLRVPLTCGSRSSAREVRRDRERPCQRPAQPIDHEAAKRRGEPARGATSPRKKAGPQELSH